MIKSYLQYSAALGGLYHMVFAGIEYYDGIGVVLKQIQPYGGSHEKEMMTNGKLRDLASNTLR